MLRRSKKVNLFFKSRIFRAGSLFFSNIWGLVLYMTVLYRTILRVIMSSVILQHFPSICLMWTKVILLLPSFKSSRIICFFSLKKWLSFCNLCSFVIILWFSIVVIWSHIFTRWVLSNVWMKSFHALGFNRKFARLREILFSCEIHVTLFNLTRKKIARIDLCPVHLIFEVF